MKNTDDEESVNIGMRVRHYVQMSGVVDDVYISKMVRAKFVRLELRLDVPEIEISLFQDTDRRDYWYDL